MTNAPQVLLPAQEKEYLTSAFAGDLCQDIDFYGDIDSLRDRIFARLPDLLKIFTIRLEKDVNSQTKRDAKSVSYLCIEGGITSSFSLPHQFSCSQSIHCMPSASGLLVLSCGHVMGATH